MRHRALRPAHLFVVRLWVETLDPGQAEVRGRVQHVLSGDVRYFRSAAALAAFLVRKTQALDIEELNIAEGEIDETDR